ncbi:manganese-dependent inorganic pyrophosphatase [Natronococcus amylolyticus DSM 10524]|uniref:inorganic diphosphatase n=1 Tax=Natronococcus amylolyticus DSM 10524 TaxID=1227497 RepID=L9WVW4_9EURY|nr:manganese-dependent inorganic pyrophosphatase [Natronococcus amylolyticus]ELY53644.1 manganese-dependent inorganic pyrophosphatase [Natronococcus amylolyticus DSM 10524]
MANPIYVIGHQQPDTDAICSALAYARLKQAQGADVVPARAGAVNPETRFVLDRWNVETPTLIDDTAADRLILVDHNEYSQAVSGARDAEIVEVVDHHRIGDVQTSDPIFFRTEPVGSTATILTHLYNEADETIDTKTAGLLLSGLLSDTVLLRSPTTTETDRSIAKRLAETADVDREEYGKELLQQKSKLGEKQPREMVLSDFKEFEFGSNHVGIGQVETVEREVVLDQRNAILAAMDEIVSERDYAVLLLLVTDVLREESVALMAGGHAATVEDALDTSFTDREAFLPDVMSRKKQIVPPLEKNFS